MTRESSARENSCGSETLERDGENFGREQQEMHSPAPSTRSPLALDFCAAPRSCCGTARR